MGSDTQIMLMRFDRRKKRVEYERGVVQYYQKKVTPTDIAHTFYRWITLLVAAPFNSSVKYSLESLPIKRVSKTPPRGSSVQYSGRDSGISKGIGEDLV